MYTTKFEKTIQEKYLLHECLILLSLSSYCSMLLDVRLAVVFALFRSYELLFAFCSNLLLSLLIVHFEF